MSAGKMVSLSLLGLLGDPNAATLFNYAKLTMKRITVGSSKG